MDGLGGRCGRRTRSARDFSRCRPLAAVRSVPLHARDSARRTAGDRDFTRGGRAQRAVSAGELLGAADGSRGRAQHGVCRVLVSRSRGLVPARAERDGNGADSRGERLGTIQHDQKSTARGRVRADGAVLRTVERPAVGDRQSAKSTAAWQSRLIKPGHFCDRRRRTGYKPVGAESWSPIADRYSSGSSPVSSARFSNFV